MISRSKLTILLTTWIETARLRNPYNKDLVDDLWRIRDIVEEIGDHPTLKERLISRVESFKKTDDTKDLLTFLKDHYNKNGCQ